MFAISMEINIWTKFTFGLSVFKKKYFAKGTKTSFQSFALVKSQNGYGRKESQVQQQRKTELPLRESLETGNTAFWILENK